jgi:hypothetical protein
VTNNEATDMLCGPEPRQRIERQLAQFTKRVLRAYDRGVNVVTHVERMGDPTFGANGGTRFTFEIGVDLTRED